KLLPGLSIALALTRQLDGTRRSAHPWQTVKRLLAAASRTARRSRAKRKCAGLPKRPVRPWAMMEGPPKPPTNSAKPTAPSCPSGKREWDAAYNNRHGFGSDKVEKWTKDGRHADVMVYHPFLIVRRKPARQ